MAGPQTQTGFLVSEAHAHQYVQFICVQTQLFIQLVHLENVISIHLQCHIILLV